MPPLPIKSIISNHLERVKRSFFRVSRADKEQGKKFRDKQKELALTDGKHLRKCLREQAENKRRTDGEQVETTDLDLGLDLGLDKDIDKEKKESKERKRFTPPTVEEVKQYLLKFALDRLGTKILLYITEN